MDPVKQKETLIKKAESNAYEGGDLDAGTLNAIERIKDGAKF